MPDRAFQQFYIQQQLEIVILSREKTITAINPQPAFNIWANYGNLKSWVHKPEPELFREKGLYKQAVFLDNNPALL